MTSKSDLNQVWREYNMYLAGTEDEHPLRFPEYARLHSGIPTEDSLLYLENVDFNV